MLMGRTCRASLIDQPLTGGRKIASEGRPKRQRTTRGTIALGWSQDNCGHNMGGHPGQKTGVKGLILIIDGRHFLQGRYYVKSTVIARFGLY